MELHPDNRNLEFMVDYETRQTITLGELLPLWWGEERAQQFEESRKTRLKVYEITKSSHVKCEDLFSEINFRKFEIYLEIQSECYTIL